MEKFWLIKQEIIDNLWENNYWVFSLDKGNLEKIKNSKEEEDSTKLVIEISKYIWEILWQNHFWIIDLKESWNVKELWIHVDNIYLENNPVNYIFLLWIFSQIITWWSTIIYNMQNSITQILDKHPNAKDLNFKYIWKHYNIETNKKFIEEKPDWIYSLNYIANWLYLPDNWEELKDKLSMDLIKFHKEILEIIKSNEIARKNIQPWEIVLFNNTGTLHNREQFSWEREIKRIRYNDPNNNKYRI